MIPLLILGTGPAASLLAIALARHDIPAQVIGRPRTAPAVEGLSQRVVAALKQLGCHEALALLGPRWHRVSSWNAQEVEMNGEFVVDRVAFDAALLRDVRAAGVDLRDGLVRELERGEGGGWCVRWEDVDGRQQRTDTALLVECRGHTAPKMAPDLHAGPTLVSLGRTFDGARAQPRTTFIESFPSGWAWGGVDPQGCAHIQVVMRPASVAAFDGDLDLAHAAALAQLTRLPQRFGRQLKATGAARARGIQAALRGAVAGNGYLRVGDAAYTCDPLSGHGMFEAASGAIATVPVIKTLLQRPAQAELARGYLRERIEAVFFSRIEVARQHYAAETHWEDEPFWQWVTQPVATRPSVARVTGPAAFATLPVVEDGFIVERRVVVSAEHPRGVRFIDGIDLGRLDALLQAGAAIVPADIGCHLGAPADAVARALRWLQTHSLLTRAGHRSGDFTTARGAFNDEKNPV
ncbi:MAG: tryptophan 7-halogenase [Methyloversatilis sp.]|uniref:flavin-dependent monooxygenase QhpG n=1 Tax=Methyloversatilis sp. TaxID=2569862 RepID=UPI002737124D|nr:tryptophan 7-halogenase [Methyloversatilis sp.]MDP3871877.1 tryptophan 7-halogenase [Methyloversatilis sp.]